MKNLWILLTILLMGAVFMAPASAVTINAAPAGEDSLWTIATNWGFTVTQAQLQAATPMSALVGGSYTIIDLARYAANDDDGGFYTAPGTTPSHTATVASISGTPLVGPDTNPYNAAVSIPLRLMNGYSYFYNNDMTTGYLGTTQNQNGAGSQANGLIFDLGKINSAYDNGMFRYYLVAFEDGGNSQPFGDRDYNDLVFVVYGNPMQSTPLPPTMLLFGSGLLGLVGWRRFRKG